MRQELIWRGMQVIEKLERETGLEPATSSLGIRLSFEYTEHMQPWRHLLITESREESAFCEFSLLNAVIAVMEGTCLELSFPRIIARQTTVDPGRSVRRGEGEQSSDSQPKSRIQIGSNRVATGLRCFEGSRADLLNIQ